MPVRLIFTIILMIIAACFTGFNLSNKCDVWLFYTFKNVPVALTILVAFLAGLFAGIISMLAARAKNAESKFNKFKKNGKDKSEIKKTFLPDDDKGKSL